MRLTRTHRTLIGALVGALALLAGSSAAEAGRTSPGPTVISGWKNGPVAIPASSDGAIATRVAALTLPAGNWVAWAKLYVSSTQYYGASNVTCSFGKASRYVVPRHYGHVLLSRTSNVVLSEGATFGSTGGKLTVACSTDGFDATAHWIKIIAMKVGTLARVNMNNGQRTVVGSGSPKAIIASGDGASLEDQGEATEVARLTLSAGAWSVRTSFTDTVVYCGYGSYCEYTYAECTFMLDGARRDIDRVGTHNVSSMIVMDGVMSSSDPQVAKVVCTGRTEWPDPFFYDPQYVSDVRITAIKLGTLVTYDHDGYPHVQGSGTPKAVYRAFDARSLTNTATLILGRLDLEAGRWMTLAKAEADDTPVDATLDAGSDFDISVVDDTEFKDLPAEVVHQFASLGYVAFSFHAPDATTGDPVLIRAIHITAFKLGSLQNVAL
jgi:hypothetical protein